MYEHKLMMYQLWYCDKVATLLDNWQLFLFDPLESALANVDFVSEEGQKDSKLGVVHCEV